MLKEYLHHRREMSKIIARERRNDTKFTDQIEAAKQRRLPPPGGQP